jgi:hypothetical protein
VVLKADHSLTSLIQGSTTNKSRINATEYSSYIQPEKENILLDMLDGTKS